ncbi:MAG TPA: pantoate--beta-alanine ligase [Dysgonamonadaceae bacterium]|nr:pantoate--beta-alanine ligase [Dysgonamonadaceae bacterium]
MVINTKDELKRFIKNAHKEQKTIGFVPTMGFLHKGHLSLVKKAKEENQLVVVSIFVNPTQFGPTEDFETYPRDIQTDTRLAMEAGADVIFNPSTEEMYVPGSSTWVEVEGDITSVLCGASRPTHFRGVTTVVNMLFNIVEPDKAYFGQKDAQQAAVLTKMVQDLHMNVEIVVCPIVREEDGVALSSRNIYLNKEEREQAAVLNRSLQLVQEAYWKGEKSVEVLTELIVKNINQMPLAEIDYVNIYAYPSLKTIAKVEEKAIAAVAVKFGKTRLIDNIILEKRK